MVLKFRALLFARIKFREFFKIAKISKNKVHGHGQCEKRRGELTIRPSPLSAKKFSPVKNLHENDTFLTNIS